MKFLATDMTEFFISTEMDFIQTSRIAYMHYYIILVGHFCHFSRNRYMYKSIFWQHGPESFICLKRCSQGEDEL